jgi:sporulation protein YlmC with PRC-barrel domain
MSYIDRDKYGMYKDKTSAGPGPALMGADTLIGDSVVNGQDEDLGDIKEIMLDMQTGQVAYAVLAFGGFLGMGEKLFAVPWQALHLDTVNHRFVLNIDKERLKNAPGFNKDAWPDMSDMTWATQIHTFYGTDPTRSGGPSMGPGVATGGVVSGMGGAGAGQGMGAGMAGSSSGTSGAGSSGVGGAGGAGMGSGSGGSMGSTSGGSLGSTSGSGSRGSARPDVDLGSSSNLNRDKTGGSDI